MKPEKNIPRRQFVKKTALAGAALSLTTVIPAKTFGANDRINVAVLGVHGRGMNHIDGFMNLDNVQVTTLVDPDMNICKEVPEVETAHLSSALVHLGKISFRLGRVLTFNPK
jgi:hypothetical protein